MYSLILLAGLWSWRRWIGKLEAERGADVMFMECYEDLKNTMWPTVVNRSGFVVKSPHCRQGLLTSGEASTEFF